MKLQFLNELNSLYATDIIVFHKSNFLCYIFSEINWFPIRILISQNTARLGPVILFQQRMTVLAKGQLTTLEQTRI